MIEVRDIHRPKRGTTGEARCASLLSAIRTAQELSRILDRPMAVFADGVQLGADVDGRVGAPVVVEQVCNSDPGGQLLLPIP